MAASTRSGSSSPVNVLPPEASAFPNLLMATRLMEQPVERSSRTNTMNGFISASLSFRRDQVLGFLEESRLVLLSAVALQIAAQLRKLARQDRFRLVKLLSFSEENRSGSLQERTAILNGGNCRKASNLSGRGRVFLAPGITRADDGLHLAQQTPLFRVGSQLLLGQQ